MIYTQALRDALLEAFAAEAQVMECSAGYTFAHWNALLTLPLGTALDGFPDWENDLDIVGGDYYTDAYEPIPQDDGMDNVRVALQVQYFRLEHLARE
jgi:hypothetical protein